MKNFRRAILTILLFASLFSNAQSTIDKTSFNSRKYAEVMILPTLFINSLSLGMSKHISEKREHAITLSAQLVVFGGPPFYASVAARYNYNIYLTKNSHFRAYVPLWCGTRYFVATGGGEQESSAFQLLLYSVGTGLGLKYQFKNQHAIRFELGLGASLNTESDIGESLTDFKLTNKNPVLPALRGGFKYLIPIGRSKKVN